MSTNRLFPSGRLSLVAAIAVLLSGCTLQEVNTPTPVGVSEAGIGMSLTAAPEFLPRDGSSMSRITAKAFDENGKPKARQRLHLEASAGTLSHSEIETDERGEAVFTFIAPGFQVNVDLVRISATPITGQSLQNANPRYVDILMSGAAFAVPSFTVTPTLTEEEELPPVGELLTFDASATTYLGAKCGFACNYSWDFADGSSTVSGPNPAVQHAFPSANVYNVILTVTAPGGTVSSVTKPVVVVAPMPPEALFTVTPDPPKVNVPAVFNGAGSTVGTGATIVLYSWDFGDGTTATHTVPSVTKTYNTVGPKPVTLTVTDSLGRTDTLALPVEVVP